jgi:flagellar hook protein FlgE
MSFQTGLSGLNASAKNLDVIGNNIANANTVGYKNARAEFANLVSSTLGSGGGNSPGIGVSVATVSSQFTQGNISITNNSMDVAINGNGFFQISKTDGTPAFTRDGQFKVDKDGNIITNTGANVMGYSTDIDGNTTSITPQKLTIPTGAPIAASQTTEINAELNLDARAPVATGANPTNFVPAIATYGTSLNVYDSQGVAVPTSFYFVRKASTTTDNWDVYDATAVDPNAAVASAATPLFQMQFDATGALTAPAGGTFALTIPTPSAVTPSIAATLDISKVTQFGTAFNVSNLTQDGYTAGDLTSVTIAGDGIITTRYSNGQTQAHGKIALADFRNVQGLVPTGSGEYLETYASGQPVQGSPGIGKFGELRAGAVEESNVDLTAELVNMMTAQRSYQANAQTIKTQDQVLSTLVNLR